MPLPQSTPTKGGTLYSYGMSPKGKGQLVPAPPLCRLDGIEAFKPGKWNGQDFTPEDIRQLNANFQRFSTGARPWYRPYFSINHDKTPHLAGLRFGSVARASIRPDGVWELDGVDIPTAVGELRNAGMLVNPSIEIVRPKIDPATGKKTGFVGPDGRIVDGPVLKCVTLLGADIPAVHGMAELPPAVFCFTGGETLKFGATFMNQTREQMVEALKALGMPVESIPPEVPDEFLAAVLTMLQNANTGLKPGGDEPPVPPPDQMADAAAALGALGLGTAPAPAGGTGGGRMPTQIVTTQKFGADAFATVAKANQQFPGLLNIIGAAIGAANTQTAARVSQQERVQADAMRRVKEQQIDRFCADMSDSGQMTPHQAQVLKPSLMLLDNTATASFSVGGKTIQTTALEAKFAEMKASFPVLRTDGRKVTQPAPPTPGEGDGALTPERRARILGGANNPHGQAALARLTAKK